jgi:hypothetical protein
VTFFSSPVFFRVFVLFACHGGSSSDFFFLCLFFPRKKKEKKTKERGDVEIRDYVVLQKPRDLTDFLSPPCTLILDFTLTHTCFGRSHLSSLGQMTHTRQTDGAPEPDGVLRTVTRAKIHHYRQLYINLPEPITFMPVVVDTAGRIYEDFSRLLFLHAHRETSALTNEIPEESEQFRFLRAACFANIKGSVGLILAKVSAMRISIPLVISVFYTITVFHSF